MYNTEYAREFNRRIKRGEQFTARSPLTGARRGVTLFKTRKGALMARSEMSGKWLSTKPEDVECVGAEAN